MDENLTIVPAEGGQMELPISVTPMDLKQLALVETVHRHMFDEDVRTIRQAIARAGVSHGTFYAALKNPYVQQQKLAEITARSDAIHTILQTSWPHIVNTQVRIASDMDNPREAVQAANFLDRLAQRSEEEIKSIEQIGGETEATRFLKEFKTRTKGRMRATRVVETIEVDNE